MVRKNRVGSSPTGGTNFSIICWKERQDVKRTSNIGSVILLLKSVEGLNPSIILINY